MFWLACTVVVDVWWKHFVVWPTLFLILFWRMRPASGRASVELLDIPTEIYFDAVRQRTHFELQKKGNYDDQVHLARL